MNNKKLYFVVVFAGSLLFLMTLSVQRHRADRVRGKLIHSAVYYSRSYDYAIHRMTYERSVEYESVYLLIHGGKAVDTLRMISDRRDYWTSQSCFYFTCDTVFVTSFPQSQNKKETNPNSKKVFYSAYALSLDQKFRIMEMGDTWNMTVLGDPEREIDYWRYPEHSYNIIAVPL